MNFRTFAVCFLLALPVLLDDLLKTGPLGLYEVLKPIIIAFVIALLWGFMATSLREKYAKNLSDSSILKIQLSLSILGICHIIFTLFSTENQKFDHIPTVIEGAALEVRAEMSLIKNCKNDPKNDPAKCEVLGNIFSKCLSDLNKPNSELVSAIEVCTLQLQSQQNSN